MERVATAFADRVLKTLLIVLTMRPTFLHVVGERKVFSTDAAVIIPVIHAAGSQAWHDEMVKHVAVGYGFGDFL